MPLDADTRSRVLCSSRYACFTPELSLGLIPRFQTATILRKDGIHEREYASSYAIIPPE